MYDVVKKLNIDGQSCPPSCPLIASDGAGLTHRIGVYMDNVTCDLSKFGQIELDKASTLLKLYAEDSTDFLTDGLTLNFNPNSGYVFLSDEDCNVAVEEEGKLVQFFSCPQCGNEGTQEEGKENGWDFKKYDGYCTKECVAKSNE